MNIVTIYSITRTIYKKTFPYKVRKLIYRNMPSPVKTLRSHVLGTLEKSAGHDEIYDAGYYTDGMNERVEKSFEVIAESIVKVFSPKSVVDVGCGLGLLLKTLQKYQVACLGLEYSSAALDICRQAGLDVIRFNLEQDAAPDHLKADVVVSTEVAEHLRGSCASHFVSILCAIGKDVLITAAEPSSTYTGTHHVNEQPKEYWINKFADNGFGYDEGTTIQFCKEWQQRKVSPWLAQHLMVFRKFRCWQ